VSEDRLTVNDLLELPAEGLPLTAILQSGISEDEAAALQEKILRGLPGMSWASIEKAVSAKLADTLDIDPINLIAGVWQKYKLLDDAAERSKAGETMFVPMAEHSMTIGLHPYVEITVGPTVVKKIDFDITLSLKLKGVKLKVEAGEIRAIETGSCEGMAEIKALHVPAWKRPIKPIDLPGKIRLGAGIPIH
jgi:hypothetical protein